MSNLFEQSAKLKVDAENLLNSSKLIEALEQYGSIYLTGALRYNLMAAADIDLYLISDQAGRQQAQAILNHLIDGSFWNAFFFGDWVQFHRPNFPKGYYLGLKHTFLEKRWKVDIWNFSEIPKQVIEIDRILETSLTQEDRQLILEIKFWRENQGIKLSSKIIYDAVLQKRVKDLSSFQNLLKKGSFTVRRMK